MDISTNLAEKPVPLNTSNDDLFLQSKATPKLQEIIEQREKTKGTKRPKLFEYDDEW